MAPKTSRAQPSERLPLTPRTPALAGVLANLAVVELYRLPGPVTTQLKLHVAAKVANSNGWRGYRGGRQRLAGWVGVYVEWLAPGEDWRFEPLVALGQTWASWTDGEYRFADVLAPGDRRDLDVVNLAEIAAGLLDTDELDAVRVLPVSAPLASRVFTPGGPMRGVPLVESELCFNEAVA